MNRTTRRTLVAFTAALLLAPPAALEGQADAAAKLLEGALDRFQDVRHMHLDRPGEKAGKGKAKAPKRQSQRP